VRARPLADNVIPTEAVAGFDCRIPATVDLAGAAERSRRRGLGQGANCLWGGTALFARVCVDWRRLPRLRLAPHFAAFKAQVDGWCGEEGVSWELVNGTGDGALLNPTSPTDGQAWELFTRAVRAAGIELHEPSIFPAATDSRWIRMALGVPCFGFSPMRRTPILLHDHDEFVGVETFLEGIRVFEAMIPVLTGAAGGQKQQDAASGGT
jgi:acetylornithine deacetylase/succinyl-diaminopimelate desuccinylase-like protein